MAWFGGTDPALELDAKIEEATSETIPNGELDIAVGLEITDMIRSKNVPPKTAMRSLKKRLTKVYGNPNLLSSTLKLIDLCVKNCGGHFVAEINTKEFVDYLVDFILKVNYDVKLYEVYSNESKFGVGNQILKLIKEWTLYFKNHDSNYLEKQYNTLVRQGYEFPAVDPLIVNGAPNFIDSEAPPDWTDGKECAICYTPFSVMNRKHHCRACGNVFCQTHSSNSIPLISLGIMQPVRVCDDCYQIHTNRNKLGDRERHKDTTTQPPAAGDDEEEQIRRAIEMSLQDSLIPANYGTSSEPPYPPTASEPAQDDEEMDDDLKAAIAASLQDTQPGTYRPPASQPQAQPSQSAQYQPQTQTQTEPELDFYLNIMNFDVNAYSDAQDGFQKQATGYQDQIANYQTEYQSTGFQNQPSGFQRQDTVFPNQNTGFQNQNTGGASSMQTTPSESMTPAQHIEQHKTRTEDLTSLEEDDINLFLQLMHGIKTDSSKQANILYDKDLAELHSKVMQLKPKLNRSLRNSIEKYEFFLDMNNKISTITRLYDQFLEAKLNQAYNKHNISSPYNQYGHTIAAPYEGQTTGPRLNDNGGYAAPDATGGQFGRPAVGPQATGPQSPVNQMTQQAGILPQQDYMRQQVTGHAPQQQTGPRYLYGNYQQTGQQYQAPQANQQNLLKNQQSPKRQQTGLQEGMPYPMEDSTPYLYMSSVQPKFTQGNVPSEPDYALRPSEPDYGLNPSEPDYAAGPSEPDFDDLVSEQQYPNYTGSYNPTNAGNPPETGKFAYPTFPSFESNSDPKLQEPQHTSSSYLQEGSEATDNESVASRFPKVPGFSDEENEENEAPKTAHASQRYPELDDIDGVSQLPQLKKLDTSESRKYRSEPEPLIEL